MDELKINNEIVEGKYEIKDFETIKASLTEALKKYDLPEVNEDNYKYAKDARASLNKLSKAIDDKRKEAQKEYMIPFSVGANQIKELVGMIDGVSDKLKGGINEIDERYRSGKRTELEQYFNSAHLSSISYTQIEDAKWYTKSFKMEDAKKAIDEKLLNIEKDVYIITSEYSDLRDRAECLSFYYKTLDLGEALRSFKEFSDSVKKIMEDLK